MGDFCAISLYDWRHKFIFNKFQLWRGATDESLQQTFWNLSIGDPQLLASSTGIPVFTDFIRHNILAGGSGTLPLNPGNSMIASRTTGKVALINIGIISHLTIIDTVNAHVLIDSDIGPGTVLLDKETKQFNITESFDRDGSNAAQGNVNSSCLDTLASFPWFSKSGPKQAIPEQFNGLLTYPSLVALSPLDKIATLTALSAKVIYDFYRRETSVEEKITAAYISGGGAHNLTLMNFLSTFFDPILVKSIEEFGIPADMRLPLALGLTIDAHINDITVPWETGSNPRVESIGKWVLP